MSAEIHKRGHTVSSNPKPVRVGLSAYKPHKAGILTSMILDKYPHLSRVRVLQKSFQFSNSYTKKNQIYHKRGYRPS